MGMHAYMGDVYACLNFEQVEQVLEKAFLERHVVPGAERVKVVELLDQFTGSPTIPDYYFPCAVFVLELEHHSMHVSDTATSVRIIPWKAAEGIGKLGWSKFREVKVEELKAAMSGA